MPIERNSFMSSIYDNAPKCEHERIRKLMQKRQAEYNKRNRMSSFCYEYIYDENGVCTVIKHPNPDYNPDYIEETQDEVIKKLKIPKIERNS